MEYVGIIFAIGSAMAWGIVYAIDQKILLELSPVALLFLYSLASAVMLAPFVFLERGIWTSVVTLSRDTALFVGLSLILSLIANVLILYAIQSLGAATASVLEITYPVFVVLTTLILFGTFPSVYVLLGGFIILIGAMVVTYFA